MTARLFKRTVKLTVYQARPPASGIIGAFFDLLPNAVEITDLRVQFTIEKQLGNQPNTCTVVVTNLSRESRAFFEQPFMHVRLDAGYDGEQRHLFAGDVLFAQSNREGTDWETTLQVGDGDRAFRHARVNRSYKAGTAVKAVLKDAARSMGLVLPDNVETSRDLEQQFAAGYALVGPTRDELTRLLAPFGYSWSIQNGALQVLRDDDTSPAQTIVISQDTGMIGVPTFAPPDVTPKKPAKKVTTSSLLRSTRSRPTLNVKSLLYPEVTPGGTIKVDNSGDIADQRDRVQGVFKVIRVTHNGDTHGDEWSTEIEAKPL